MSFTLRKKQLIYEVSPGYKRFTNKSEAFKFASKVLEQEKQKNIFKRAEIKIECREIKIPVVVGY